MDTYCSQYLCHRSAGCSHPDDSMSTLASTTTTAPAPAPALKFAAPVSYWLFLLTFHWPRQVTWSQLTSKAIRKYNPVMCLKGETWNSWEQPTETLWIKEPERWVYKGRVLTHWIGLIVFDHYDQPQHVTFRTCSHRPETVWQHHSLKPILPGSTSRFLWVVGAVIS